MRNAINRSYIDPGPIPSQDLLFTPETETSSSPSQHLYETNQNLWMDPEEPIVSQNILWSVFNALADMIFVVNQDGIVKFINKAAKNLSAEEIKGKPFHYISPIVEMIPFSAIKDALTSPNATYYLRGLHLKVHNGNPEIDFMAQRLSLHGETFQGYIYILKKINTKRSTKKKRLRNVINIQEKERNRIALNLHDSLGHKMSASNFFINAAINSDETEKTKHLLSKATSTLREAIYEIRQICFDLMPRSIKEAGIEMALNDLLEGMKANNSILFSLNINIKRKIPQHIELDLFRIIQELLTNSIKHGQATEVNISLCENKDRIELIFRDNGIGFNTAKKYSGQGLRNMELRVTSNNGSIYAASIPNVKTEFSIIIPLHKSSRKIHADQVVDC